MGHKLQFCTFRCDLVNVNCQGNEEAAMRKGQRYTAHLFSKSVIPSRPNLLVAPSVVALRAKFSLSEGCSTCRADVQLPFRPDRGNGGTARYVTGGGVTLQRTTCCQRDGKAAQEV